VDEQGLVTHCDGLLENCILRYETGQLFLNHTAVLRYCCYPGAVGEGNIDADPLFVDPNDSDYHLLPDSPCINTGDPGYIPVAHEIDLDGNSRMIGPAVDMGCYEFPNTAPVADAGTNQTVFAWVDWLAAVQLDGTGSYDTDGDSLEYFWYNDANDLIAIGAEPNVILPIGRHVIDLIVSDGIEDSESNSCVITVIQPFETPARMLPATINVKSRRPYLIGRIEFPGEEMPVLAPDQLMLLLTDSSEVQAERQMLVYSEDPAAWYLMGFFDREMVTGNLIVGREAEITLVSRFDSGQWIYGINTVMVKGRMKVKEKNKAAEVFVDRAGTEGKSPSTKKPMPKR